MAPATTEIYTLSLHDALPISMSRRVLSALRVQLSESFRLWCLALGATGAPHSYFISIRLIIIRIVSAAVPRAVHGRAARVSRSEEHTSELQSRRELVCRLLLE